MYKHIEDYLKTYCGVDARIQVYRQLCVKIGRVFLGSEFELELDELDVLALQMGHTAKTARFHYANEVCHLPAMSSDLLLRYGRASEAWWKVIGFGLRPGAAPTLPLRQHRKNLQENNAALLEEIKSLQETVKLLNLKLSRTSSLL